MKPSLVFVSILMAASAIADTAPAALDQAKAALVKNDLAAAETLLVPLTTGEKPDAAACHELAGVRLRQGRTTDAIALHEKATTLAPANAGYWSALGMAIGQRMGEITFMQQALLAGKLKKAFAKSVELDPNHVPGLIGLARYYTNAPEIAGGSLEKAKEYALRAQKLNPFLGEIELGTIAEQGEDFATALGHFDAAAKLQPNNAWVHTAAGRVLAKLNRKDEARTRLQRALELDPKREAAKKALAALDASAP